MQPKEVATKTQRHEETLRKEGREEKQERDVIARQEAIHLSITGLAKRLRSYAMHYREERYVLYETGLQSGGGLLRTL